MQTSRALEVLPFFPPRLRSRLEGLMLQGIEMEEIRLRANAPLTVSIWGESCFVTDSGGLTNHESNACSVTEKEVQAAFLGICENSVYAHLEEIRQGFLTLKGGHRVGICGKAVMENGKIKTFREVSSLNFRIAHQVFGAADRVIERIVRGSEVKSSLIVSLPQTGKTTLLRDITRQISNRGFKVGVADDRGELGAMYDGVLQNDLGAQTDLIDNAPKAEAISLLLRTMSPRVLVSDEIASVEDVNAIRIAHGTGVAILATTHGRDIFEVKQRQLLKPLFRDGVFEQAILLHRDFSSPDARADTEVIAL